MHKQSTRIKCKNNLHSIAKTLTPNKLDSRTTRPITFMGNVRTDTQSVIYFSHYSWKIFSHDKTFSSGKVWIALIIHYVQLMVIIYIWPLKLLSLIVHYKRLLRVNVFAIECIQTLRVTLWVQSKQPRTIKTIIYNDIFTSLGRKNVLSPAKQFK